MKKLLILLSTISLLGFTLGTASAQTVPACNGSTFDDFATGTVNGQNGWYVSGPYDQEIVPNTFGVSGFGCKSLRISDATTSVFIYNQVFSGPSNGEAGEATALNSNGATGTTNNRFEAQFDLASVTGNEQPGMHLSVSPDRGDGTRMSSLGFLDTASGIDVYFDDVTGTTSPVTFNDTFIGTLSRTTAHTIKYVMDFLEGPSNDIVKVYIDGNLVHTGTSWENFYRYDSSAYNGPTASSSRTVGHLVFYEPNPAHSTNQYGGYLIDNVSLTSTTTPSSTSTPPVITLNGSSTMNLFVGDTFTDPGATAVDSSSTTIPVTATGTVNTSATGTYTIIYSATDSNSNTATTSRSVIVAATSTATTTPSSTSGGGSGGVFSSPSSGGGYFVYSPLISVNTPSSSGTGTTGGNLATLPPISVGVVSSPTGQVLGVAVFNFTRNLRMGSRGDDVLELQKYLSTHGYLTITIPTRYFGKLTQKALMKWQKDNKLPATGYFGAMSRMAITK